MSYKNQLKQEELKKVTGGNDETDVSRQEKDKTTIGVGKWIGIIDRATNPISEAGIGGGEGSKIIAGSTDPENS